ncbi:hypothetical protein BK635_13045 [Pseudomonas chlororaphis]|uniref:hypothetical protein n=1 Tax=Pseudomonas chlororaphis TaxID=587753 RepID=UPI000F4915D1|nr:hypothetical protein [Pseudomonas chlororaphis]RON82423.1 hypothetical protein BK635_13045 [Pseudomonas chlororaphis]
MKISDMDMGKLVDAIGSATFPVVFEGIGEHTPPSELRERANLNSEIMGRIMGVLLCGDEVGQEVFELIDRSIGHMKASHAESFEELLGPGGSLSKIHKL